LTTFLLDENLPRRLAEGLRLCTFDVYAVGDGSGPPTGSTDEEVVAWCLQHAAVLVTADAGRKNPEMVNLLRARAVRVMLVPMGMPPRDFVTAFVSRHPRVAEDAARGRACRYRMGKNGRLSKYP
jgi:uncharacterized protein with PIN domain